MYQKTELCVKTDRSNVTDSFSSNIGVRQGDNLNPNLLKLFINDLPEIFDQTCNPATLNSLKLNCLLYADDIVLLSETAEGLQNSLDKLSRYCKKWGMEINTDKTKSLVFNSTGRLFPVTFMIDNQLINKVKQYRYLGVMFNASGSFSDAKEELYKRGLKALFKMYKCFEGHKPKIKTLLHVFDHPVKPILTYGSEVWGTFDPQKLLDKGDNYFSKLCNDLKAEKAHMKFCKFSLGVGKRSSNLAVIEELGRYLLFIEIIISMFSHLTRLSNSKDILLSESLSVSKLLSDQNKKSWYSTILSLLKYLKLDLRFVMNSKTNLKHFLYTKLKSNYNRLWFLSLHDDKINKDFGNKLRTYRLFKNNISLEPYLSMKNDEQRILLSKLRISNHNLEIERGRHRGLQAKERICKLCLKEVEDEIHFLLKCEALQNVRTPFIDLINYNNYNFKHLDIREQFIWLMSNEDNFIINQLSDMILKLHSSRNDIIQN